MLKKCPKLLGCLANSESWTVRLFMALSWRLIEVIIDHESHHHNLTGRITILDKFWSPFSLGVFRLKSDPGWVIGGLPPVFPLPALVSDPPILLPPLALCSNHLHKIDHLFVSMFFWVSPYWRLKKFKEEKLPKVFNLPDIPHFRVGVRLWWSHVSLSPGRWI